MYSSQCSDYADCNIPPPFSQRVKNALKAEPRSVKLSSLVGSGGMWYGFGKMIMSLWVGFFRSFRTPPQVPSLDDEQKKELSDVLTKVSLVVVLDNHHYFTQRNNPPVPETKACRHYGPSSTFRCSEFVQFWCLCRPGRGGLPKWIGWDREKECVSLAILRRRIAEIL